MLDPKRNPYPNPRSELLVNDAQAALRDVLEEDDLRELLHWLERLAKNPFSQEDTAPVVPGMTQWQPCIADAQVVLEFLGFLVTRLPSSAMRARPMLSQV